MQGILQKRQALLLTSKKVSKVTGMKGTIQPNKVNTVTQKGSRGTLKNRKYISLVTPRDIQITDVAFLKVGVSKKRNSENPVLACRIFIKTPNYKGATNDGFIIPLDCIDEYIDTLLSIHEECENAGLL
jgi:hypothetical protein